MHVPRADLLRKNGHVTRGKLSLSHVLPTHGLIFGEKNRSGSHHPPSISIYQIYFKNLFNFLAQRGSYYSEVSFHCTFRNRRWKALFLKYQENVTDLVLVIFSRELFFIHVKISHSYTRNYLKIWKDKILKSVITWFEMGQQTTQSKNVCLKLSENKSRLYRYWQLYCMIVMWDTYNT